MEIGSNSCATKTHGRKEVEEEEEGENEEKEKEEEWDEEVVQTQHFIVVSFIHIHISRHFSIQLNELSVCKM